MKYKPQKLDISMKIRVEMMKLLFLVMIVAMASCGGSSNESDTVELVEDSLKSSVDTSVDICFDDFIHNFTCDKEFQSTRNKVGNVDISKLYGCHIGYEYALYFYNSFNEKEVFNKDLTTEKYLSILNPTESKKTTLYFEKIDGRWFLVKIQDFGFDFNNIVNFEAFIYQFYTDSIFRKEYIKFPLKYVSIDYDNDYEEKTDYLEDSVYIYNFFEKGRLTFFHNKEIGKKNNIKIQYRGIDNGILGYFYFEKYNNTWRLTENCDYSM